MNKYFQDAKGNQSSTRLIVFIVAMFAVLLASWLVVVKYDVQGAAAIMGTFGTFILSFKGMGKYLENKEQ
jgi:hypothetical protein